MPFPRPSSSRSSQQDSCSCSIRSPTRTTWARSFAPPTGGRCLRTAAAFAVGAVVITARHSPEATGVLAKAASGALEYVPIVTVQNLARTLATLREHGFCLVGLDSTGERDLREASL